MEKTPTPPQIVIPPDSNSKETEEQQPLLSFSAPPWVMAALVTDFDNEMGQKIEYIYPPEIGNCLSHELKTDLAFLSFSDSNSQSNEHTTQFCFQHPIFGLKECYGFVYFLQKKEKFANNRGFFQKSVVLLTQWPLLDLFQNILMPIVGQKFFSRFFTFFEKNLELFKKNPQEREKRTLEFEQSFFDKIFYEFSIWPKFEMDKEFELSFGKRSFKYRTPVFQNLQNEKTSQKIPEIQIPPISPLDSFSNDYRIMKEMNSNPKNSDNSEKKDTYFALKNCSYFVEKFGKNFIFQHKLVPIFQNPPLSNKSFWFSKKNMQILFQIWEILLLSSSANFHNSKKNHKVLLVYTPEVESPYLCSNFVFFVLSLLAPLQYSGSIFPFLPVHTNIFQSWLKSWDQKKPIINNSMIIGVSNPFFLKIFEEKFCDAEKSSFFVLKIENSSLELNEVTKSSERFAFSSEIHEKSADFLLNSMKKEFQIQKIKNWGAEECKNVQEKFFKFFLEFNEQFLAPLNICLETATRILKKISIQKRKVEAEDFLVADKRTRFEYQLNLSCLNFLLKSELEKNLVEDPALFWKLLQKFQFFYQNHQNFFQNSNSPKKPTRSSSLPSTSSPAIINETSENSLENLEKSAKNSNEKNKIFKFLERQYSSFEEFKRKNFNLTFDIGNTNSLSPNNSTNNSSLRNEKNLNSILGSGGNSPLNNSGSGFFGSLTRSFSDLLANGLIFGESTSSSNSSTFSSNWLHLYQKFIFSDNFHNWFSHQIKKFYYFEIMNFEFSEFLKKIDKALELTGFEEKNKLQRPKELFSEIQKIDFFMQIKSELEVELMGKDGWFCFFNDSGETSPFSPVQNENSTKNYLISEKNASEQYEKQFIKKVFDIMEQIIHSFKTPSIQSSLSNTLTQARFLIKQKEIETKALEIEIPSNI